VRKWQKKGMSAETKTTDTDPQERADFEAVLRHAFHAEPLDPEVAHRVHERAARVIENMREIDDETFQALIQDDDA
jgi:hypothetical protein